MSVSGSSDVMDPREEEQLPPDPTVLPSESEWDTDLDTDSRKHSLFSDEQYLHACRWAGSIPVSFFLSHQGEADLNLNHYGVGPLGAKALGWILQNDQIITNLELEDNALQAEGTYHLMEMLQTNITIQNLNLSNNQLRLEGADLVSKMISDNCIIRSIKLSGNGFDDTAAEYFADAFERNDIIRELDLSHNKISATGGQHLGNMLVTNIGLEVLNLSWNHLCMGSAVALSAGLKVNSTLKQLQLSRNGFGRIEAESLGQALKQNGTLVLLDLSRNLIDNKAVDLLCKGLVTNDALKVLKLSHNPLTNIGALSLLRTVTKNTSSAIEDMDISTVFVCETFVELLEEVCQRRPGLVIRHSVMHSVTRNISALRDFQKFLQGRNESIMDFFQALDKERTMKVPTVAFRQAVKEANAPLDQRQLEWLIKKFDQNCKFTIAYSQLADL
ncbi:leucine-rich repeat-containing protein 74A-like [Clinocottus analis]|uniref:leucine-rich repeat-containing protein 74A-like n=1 Tax=Clinocottus analis TaxID=304258 RepID=UPI0035C17D8F